MQMIIPSVKARFLGLIDKMNKRGTIRISGTSKSPTTTLKARLRMKILIIGGGAREHAIGRKLKLDSPEADLYFAPGNGGTTRIGANVPIKANDVRALLAYAQLKEIDFTIVGPEDPLIAGIVDEFKAAGLKVFGPMRAAAQIEGSKAFAKELMNEHGIRTAKHRSFTGFTAACKYAKWIFSEGNTCFVKASGPAMGKGAIACETLEAAETALRELMIENKFGENGKEVVIELTLQGKELSVHAICSNQDYVLFPLARDHKRAHDGDKGENTGGMGAIAPVPVENSTLDRIKHHVIEPALGGMQSRGSPFTGLMFPGIMQTREGPMVLEFNARFGDPETEVLMKLLDCDLLQLLEAAVDGKLKDFNAKWKPGTAVCVILASEGYPGEYKKGVPINGIEEAEAIPGVTVYHAGTKIQDDGTLVTAGGRVLAVTCYAEAIDVALRRVYRAVSYIHFQGMHFRRDIGKSLLQEATP
jgi:phosphoribosylamine---glycine ligase